MAFPIKVAVDMVLLQVHDSEAVLCQKAADDLLLKQAQEVELVLPVKYAVDLELL